MKNSKLKLLIKNGLKKKIGTKWFKIVNLILLIAIPLVINIDTVIKTFGGDFDDPITVYMIDDTETYYELFNKIYNETTTTMGTMDVEIKKAKKDYKTLKKEMLKDKTNDIILTIKKENGEYKAELTSFEYVDVIVVQMITNSLNTTKSTIALNESDIDQNVLAEINAPMNITRNYLSDELDENYELMSYLSNLIIPVFIMPFFFLLLMVTQMIGAEINEEKSSKSMEIIITSVSPKTHFISKMITSNLYAIVQSVLFIIYFIIGLFIRVQITGAGLIDSFGENMSGMLKTFVESGMLADILKGIPWIIILLLLSFIAYSLLAGILASMTTSQEDYQQLQTPLMIIIMVAYFVAIMASTYEKSTFIIILSLIPFLSCIIAPVLLLIGQIGIIQILIALGLLILTIFILLRYGLRVYKVGILNYSSDKLWKKMFRSIKTKEQ